MEPKLSDLIKAHPERKYFLCAETKEGAENLTPFMQSVKRSDFFIENGKPFVEYQPIGVIAPVASNPPHKNDTELAAALRKQLSTDEKRYNYYRVLVTEASPHVKYFAEQLQKALDDKNIPFDISLHKRALTFTGNRADNQDINLYTLATKCDTRQSCIDAYNRIVDNIEHAVNNAATAQESMRLYGELKPLRETVFDVTTKFDPDKMSPLSPKPSQEEQRFAKAIQSFGRQGNFFGDDEPMSSLDSLIAAAERTDNTPVKNTAPGKNKDVR